MINQVADKITDRIDFSKAGQTVSYLNIYNYSILRKHPDLMEKIDQFTLDGIMLVVFMKVFMGRKLKRTAPDFSSYFTKLFRFFETKDKKVVFLGGSAYDIENFVAVVKQEYPGLNISKAFNGFDFQQDEVLDHLQAHAIDAVIVGLGTPKQEMFLAEAKASGYSGSAFSCGAFISQTANKGHYYFPVWTNRLHLRWLYRIFKEPKLAKRYLIHYPIGLFLLIRDRLFVT